MTTKGDRTITAAIERGRILAEYLLTDDKTDVIAARHGVTRTGVRTLARRAHLPPRPQNGLKRVGG
jgi:hypothetical protein